MEFSSLSSRGRGRGRGWTERRGGRGGYRNTSLGKSNLKHSPAPTTFVKDKPLERKDPLGAIIDSFDLKTLLVDEQNPIIENVEYVASYNWVKGKIPKILVPGSPPRWTPPTYDRKLDTDRREAFRDVNAARWPSYPLEPTIRSIHLMRPDFDLGSVDVLGCSHTISKLLGAVGTEQQPFRFDADVIGDTVLFTRKGASPTELLTIVGYGFRFPETYTTWDTGFEESISHQRTVNYTFGGLNILIRSGGNGYVGNDKKFLLNRDEDPVQISDDFKTKDTTPKIPVLNEAPDASQGLQIVQRGTVIPQRLTFDIKTRSIYNQIDMTTIYPLLWLGQIPKFLIAYHQYGTFKPPTIEDKTQDLQQWQDKNASSLARFHALLKGIIDSVRDAGAPCEVSWDGSGDVLVTLQEGEGRRALPDNLHTFFIN